MKIIDTSVVDATKQYPGLANVGNQSIGNPPLTSSGDPTKFQGLDFLQQNVLDMVGALCKSMLVDTTKATMIYSTGYQVGIDIYMGGYIYYNGEIFLMPNQLMMPMIMGHYYIANIISNPTDNGVTAPLTTMSDGTQVSIHNQRTITTSLVSSGTGNMPNVADWVGVQNNFQWAFPAIHVVGGIYEPPFAAGWSTGTRLAFYILGNEVTIQGDVSFATSAGAIIFILPNGYRPNQPLFFYANLILVGDSSVGIDTSGRVEFLGSTSVSSIVNFTAKYTIL